jgi:hypothetical protein
MLFWAVFTSCERMEEGGEVGIRYFIPSILFI